jgi:hypothetical protein
MKFYFRELSLAARFSRKIWETFWESSGKRLFPRLLGNTQSTCDTWNQGLDSRRAASWLLAQASLLPSSWYWRRQWPDWTPSWRGARACAPGSCSWSVRTRKPNSAASHASGSLGVQYHRQWSAHSSDANLVLVVLGGLSRQRSIYHRSVFCRRFCSNSSVERGFCYQSVLGGRHGKGESGMKYWIE